MKSLDGVDKNGEPVMRTIEKGKQFNMNDIPNSEKVVARDASRVDDTIHTKMVKGAWEGLTDGFDKLVGGKSPLQSSNSSINSSTDSGNNNHSSNTHDSSFDNPHDDSFNKNIPNSTTKSENVKDIKGFSGKLRSYLI